MTSAVGARIPFRTSMWAPSMAAGMRGTQPGAEAEDRNREAEHRRTVVGLVGQGRMALAALDR